MIASVAKWGNSLALRIPSAFARQIDVSEGVAVDISVANRTLLVRPVEEQVAYELDDLLRRITEENRHGEISSGASVGNEF
ncbi:MAG: AbrB/MazE/SpoVT family DNA-binding domain-containing protein [Nitratireductor sp.]|nr:AbrB/MazE/SpoVT family DNA-binding domain-containing protein [Nitratireductor sp.]